MPSKDNKEAPMQRTISCCCATGSEECYSRCSSSAETRGLVGDGNCWDGRGREGRKSLPSPAHWSPEDLKRCNLPSNTHKHILSWTFPRLPLNATSTCNAKLQSLTFKRLIAEASVCRWSCCWRKSSLKIVWLSNKVFKTTTEEQLTYGRLISCGFLEERIGSERSDRTQKYRKIPGGEDAL